MRSTTLLRLTRIRNSLLLKNETGIMIPLQPYASRVAAVWALGGGIILLLITAVTGLNIAASIGDRIARWFDLSLSSPGGYEDFVSVAIATAALMFLPWCQWQHGHVTINFLVRQLPKLLQHVLYRLSLGLTIAMSLFLAWWMGQGLLTGYTDQVLTPILSWPLWPFYAPGVLSLLLWSLIASIQLLNAFCNGAISDDG